MFPSRCSCSKLLLIFFWIEHCGGFSGNANIQGGLSLSVSEMTSARRRRRRRRGLLLSCAASIAEGMAAPESKLSDGLFPNNFDHHSNDVLPWFSAGYCTWRWRGQKINYLELGDPSRPALLLLHGFGASFYHFRHNIPQLARQYHVYAFDLLGFGLSSKPVQNYPIETWRDQASDFIRQVIGKPTTVCGNSLGGFTALYVASDSQAMPLVNGCILLNSAGPFRNKTGFHWIKSSPSTTHLKHIIRITTPILRTISDTFQRLVVQLSFLYTKRPSQIERVLKSVYPVHPHMVDSNLVDSIRLPSEDPNASEVFFRVVAKAGRPSIFLDDLLQKLRVPLLLCWGEKDPWMTSSKADRIQSIYPPARRVSVNAGHCPHDEDPKVVNHAIQTFIRKEVIPMELLPLRP